MNFWRWLGRLGRRPRDAAPSLHEAEVYDEASKRLAAAIESTRSETRRLDSDASELADRIRSNTRKGRSLFEGKP